jgi:putative peptidoglycan lipid II flippase
LTPAKLLRSRRSCGRWRGDRASITHPIIAGDPDGGGIVRGVDYDRAAFGSAIGRAQGQEKTIDRVGSALRPRCAAKAWPGAHPDGRIDCAAAAPAAVKNASATTKMRIAAVQGDRAAPNRLAGAIAAATRPSANKDFLRAWFRLNPAACAVRRSLGAVMSLARNTLVQSGLTLGSRVLGFVRDLYLNARFGQGPLMDAFATALMLPNLFRRLFAEGAFAQAFVPIYAKTQTESGPEEAERVASAALSFLLAVVALFCVALQVAMPWLMLGLLSAYADQPKVMQIAVLATQITMPYLVFMTIASLLSGVLNTAGRFALSAAVPTLLNVCTLVPLMLMPGDRATLLAVAAAVSVAGILQAGLLWWGMGRLGVRLKLGWPRLTPDVKRILLLALPGVIAGGATQINSLTSQVLTGTDEGARSVLYNADRLYQLPLGLVGVAVGLALVPRLSKAFAANDDVGGKAAMDQGISLAMAFTLPAAAALLVMPFFIIDATVTRGAFSSEDARRTAEVLRHFAWGVPAFVLAKVFTPPFFARQDTKRPMRFALMTVAISTVAGAGLFFGLNQSGLDGVQGLAIATSAAAWINVFLLAATLAREGAYIMSAKLWGRLMRAVAAVALMAAFIGVCAWQYPLLKTVLLYKEIAVVIVCLAGFALYGLAAVVFGAVSVSEIRGALRREAGAPGVPRDLDV